MASSDALEKVEALKTRLANMRVRAEKASEKFQRKAACGITAFWYGSKRARGESVPFSDLLGRGTRPSTTLAVLTFVGSEYMGGRVGEILDGVSDGMIAVAAFEAGSESGRRGAAGGAGGAGGGP